MKMYNVAVIGGGVIGVTTATAIQDHFKSNVKITIYSEKLSPYTTSDVAAGLWGPYLLQETEVEKIAKWGKQTHDYFLHLWKTGYANEAGISLQFVNSVLSPESVYTSNIVLGEYPASSIQVEELSKLLKSPYKKGTSYVTVACESAKFLPFLLQKFICNGGNIKIKKISNFEELSDYDVIVNCSGLNAFDLTGDTQLTPIRGQIVRVKAPWQFHTILSDKGYIISNIDSVVLGGTTQVNDYETNVRDSDSKKILNNCYNLMPTLKNAQIVKHVVGLRPGRREVRLEKEVKVIKGKKISIIHNYGHGGAGVTLSYGCALSAVDLIKEDLSIPYMSKL